MSSDRLDPDPTQRIRIRNSDQKVFDKEYQNTGYLIFASHWNTSITTQIGYATGIVNSRAESDYNVRIETPFFYLPWTLLQRKRIRTLIHSIHIIWSLINRCAWKVQFRVVFCFFFFCFRLLFRWKAVRNQIFFSTKSFLEACATCSDLPSNISPMV